MEDIGNGIVAIPGTLIIGPPAVAEIAFCPFLNGSTNLVGPQENNRKENRKKNRNRLLIVIVVFFTKIINLGV
jgi:hypothetical protein